MYWRSLGSKLTGTVKFLNFQTLDHPKTAKKRFYHRVMHPKDADSIVNSEDPEQTAPLGAVRSGSALFAQANLSENLEPLRVVNLKYCKNWTLNEKNCFGNRGLLIKCKLILSC